MPFLEDDAQTIDLSRRIDTPKGFAVTPGAADLDDGSAKPSWNWGAAFRRNNEMAALAASNSAWSSNEPEAGFNPWDKVKGTPDEVNFRPLSEARNTQRFDAIKADIARENEDRKLLDSQPWWMGLITEGTAGILSPTSLIPGGTFVKGAQGGIAILKAGARVGLATAGSAAIQEGMLQNIEQTRTASESAVAIGASLFFGGLLGAGGQALLSKAEWQKGVAAIERDLGELRKGLDPEDVLQAANSNEFGLRSVGAAANTATDLGDNTIAGRAAGAVAGATAQMNPLLRALHSPSAAWREIGTDLFENPLYLKKNFEGVASQPAVETLMKEYNGGLAKALQATNDAYPEYVKAGGQLAKDEFREAVGKAMRRGDTDADPVIAKVAQEYRARVFDPLKKQAIDVGLLPADVSVDTAQSYFSRMWNGRKISADEQGFKGVVQDWVAQQSPKWAEQFDKTAERRLNPLRQEIADLEMAKLRRGDELEARKKDGETIDTRGGGMQFHGTSQPDLRPDGTHYSTKNYYGQGFYTTDAVDIAHGYSKRGAKTDADRRLYRVEPVRDLNILDGEQKIPDSVLHEISPPGKPLDDVIEMAIEEGPANVRELYDTIREVGTGEGLSADSIQELFAIVNESMVKAGYDGLSHVGGIKTKNAAHKVVIYFNPEKDLRTIEDVYGNYKDAPNLGEMTEADIRQALRIVEGKAPAPKGVKTLSQFVVEAGGLMDDAGELAHRGITNKARPGMIRKERRSEMTGKGGWTLDDMARHAWENDYFPHSANRPSIDEFVEALNDDFSKTRAVLKHGDQDAYRLTELVDQLEADLSRAGVKADGKAPRFSTSEEMKGAVERVYKALDAEADRKATLLRQKLSEREADIRVDRESRFVGDPKELGKSIADEVFDTLTGRTGGGVRNDFLTIKARGPLKERTFNIQDLFQASNGRAVEDYLEHDVEQVARRYTRVMGADVELQRKFGSVDMIDQINKIRDDYRSLRDGITDEKQLTALAKREKNDIGDLEAVRDMLRGTNPGAPADANYSRIVRSVNHLNYLRSMGEVAIASLTETVRPAMVHGLMPYMSTLGQTLTNMKGIKASVQEAQIAGTVTERVLGTRLATLSEIIDPYASRGPVEAFLENMTNIASRWNGIRLLTDMQKTIAAVMTQNRLLKGAAGYAELAPKEKAYLAYLGIDQSMAERIAKQFADHGETVDKVHVANQEKWTDEVAARTYRAAISKDVDSIITTKGVADTPLFANTPTGRAMLQFKSFALASHQRVLLRGLQEDQARFVGGLVAMTTIGMMATWLKAVSGNRTEKLQDIGKNPGWWIAEGFDKAGIFAIPVELANTFEKATGFNPVKTPMKAFDQGSAISQKNQNRSLLGSVVGPTGGLIDDATQVMGLPQKMLKGEEITQGQKNAAERLMPFNSYVGIRQMLRYVVNPQTP